MAEDNCNDLIDKINEEIKEYHELEQKMNNCEKQIEETGLNYELQNERYELNEEMRETKYEIGHFIIKLEKNGCELKKLI